MTHLAIEVNTSLTEHHGLWEVSILFTLRHPRIVSLFDVVEGRDQLHLATWASKSSAELSLVGLFRVHYDKDMVHMHGYILS